MKIKLLIEYDGTAYGGWQVQKNARTVQGEILAAAERIFPGVKMELYGAGRTDAGVHARGQVAHLVCPESLPLPVLKDRLNDFLPTDIHILSLELADPRFHARHHAVSRHYTYQVSLRRDALNRKTVWWVKEPLSLPRMKEAARLLVGFHDFMAFSDEKKPSPRPDSSPAGARIHENSTWVNLTGLDVVEVGDQVHFELTGSHFLRKMVRRLVGCLVEVGKGTVTSEQLASWLITNPGGEPAAFTAPPHGLFLTRIDY